MVKKIMVVDDDTGTVYSIKYGIERLDKTYEVIPADSGKKCLELLGNNNIPDLILLDIMMPEMSGWETYQKIKQNDLWKNIPIVFLTARKDQIAKKAGSFLGDDYIEKPCNLPQIKEKIDKILKNK